MQCYECDASAEHQHHVIPRILGGKRTIPLCGRCHGLVHNAPQLTSTSALTKAGLVRARAAGQITSRFPQYGYQRKSSDSVRVVPNEYERTIITEARRLHAAGLSLRAVSRTLAEHGKLSRAGRAFTPSAIAAMLR